MFMAQIRVVACLIILITLALSAGAADTNGTDHRPSDTRRAYQSKEVPVSMAVGFPTTDRNGLWTWPVRRLDADPLDSGASVRYTSYPTGYAGSQGRCCRGDTTSGTRAYHWDTLKALFQEVECWDSVKTMPQLLQRLDFLQRDRLGSGRAAATCMVPPLVEDDYVGPSHLVPRSELPKDWHPKIEELGYRQRSPMTIRWEPSDELVDDTPKVMVLYCGPLDLKPQMQKFRRAYPSGRRCHRQFFFGAMALLSDRVREAFKTWDTEGDGTITKTGLIRLLRKIAPQVTESDLEVLFEAAGATVSFSSTYFDWFESHIWLMSYTTFSYRYRYNP
ncbi:unnamed protein product [Cladocopium goreaui]|uniref:Protein kinase domain-containing protein n=1 Tax=Cladocopium goreaui TaxID=2562237 RepID=A0A9P1CYW0_9DINO|nr:unnamed protein product [Cladocopium goreaui]